MDRPKGEAIIGFRCSLCQEHYPLSAEPLVCPACNAKQDPREPLRGILEVWWDYEALQKRVPVKVRDLNPLDLLPVEREYFPPIPVGNTPLWKPLGLWEKLGVGDLYLKDDGVNPTGSLKDRASFLVAAFAKKMGRRVIAVASTGNAASSMAGVGAAAGIGVRIFMPQTAPLAKRVQSLLYGAEVTLVKGTYDEAYDASLEYCASHPEVLSRNTAQQPLTIEGKKTVALEIIRDLGEAPSRVYVSAGDGVILSGVYRGLEDLWKLGLIPRVPEVVAVQAEGSSAIARAFQTGSFGPPQRARTVADSISVEIPRCGYLATQKLSRHKGRVVLVSDAEILEAQRRLCAWAGLFSEPAGSTAFAGYLKDQGFWGKKALGGEMEGPTVVLLTGNGLKDVETAQKGLALYP